MTPCADKEALLSALVDGELDAANAQQLEAHLRTCPRCAEVLADLQALRVRLREDDLRYRAPGALRAKIGATLDAEAAPRRRIARGPIWALGGAAAGAAASFAVMLSTAAAPALETQLVENHVRSTLASHLVDVAASDRHVVKPWFNGRIDFAPPVPDLADAGYPLAGGRLDYVQGRVVAAVVYRRNRHVINLFAWPADRRPTLPRPGSEHDGYAMVNWRDQGLQFWAVSDIDPADLRAFRRAYEARVARAESVPAEH